MWRRVALFGILLLVSAWFPHGNGGYKGPCDQVSCDEAYSVTRSLKASYSGPLFQLWNGSTTLDIGQTNHIADMTTWSAFCSGVQSNCKVSKIYAQIHTGPNDLIPSIYTYYPPSTCSV